jgi:hypothetical protein
VKVLQVEPMGVEIDIYVRKHGIQLFLLSCSSIYGKLGVQRTSCEALKLTSSDMKKKIN